MKQNQQSKEKNNRKRIVVLTGAGISAESGLNTYSGQSGFKEKCDYIYLASVKGFEENPEAVLNFYNMRRKHLHEAKPNHAHKMLAELEKDYEVIIITQNVDNLHERAGSTNILHLHGELAKVTSSRHRNAPECIMDMPLDVPIKIGDIAPDGAQLRPYVVWFGELVNTYQVAARIVRSADIFLVIGSSLKVTPAADLIKCPHYNVPIFIIDPCDPFDPYDDNRPDHYEHIAENATTGIDTFIKKLAVSSTQ